MTIDTLRKRIRAAKGEITVDLLFKNGLVVNVFSGTIEKRDVAL